jgi:uncharacterized protein (DUF1501 family)
LLLGGASFAAWAYLPKFARAADGRDPRLVVVILRGALDGLATVAPVGDPDYAGLHGSIALTSDGPHAALMLDSFFALHPSMPEFARMVREKHAAVIHAVATPYRDRSHFDGQNVLETGGTAPYQLKDGWLNRLVGMLPATREKAIAFAPTIPAALRGAVQVASYAPSALPAAPDDLLTRVSALYEGDRQLGPLWAEAMKTRELTGAATARQDPAQLGKMAADFLSRSDGPRIAMIETGGWDTHTAQNQRLGNQLKALDTMLGALRDGLGQHWNDTTVLVATEFGRTAAANGTGGTDHGQGSVAMLMGGQVAGGRVVADWPGLSSANLYEGRDLKPTSSLDALIAGVAARSLDLDPQRTAHTLFGTAPAQKPMTDLLRA